MTTSRGARAKKGKIDSEVEKLRAEGNLSRACESLYPYKNDHTMWCLFNLVSAENKLENFESGFLTDEDIEASEMYISEAMKTSDEQYKFEASVLSGKILYLRKSFTTALEALRKLKLMTVRIDYYGLRFARIISEGVATMGLCIEELAQQTRRPLSEDARTEACTYYDFASEVCIRHYQEFYQGQADQSVVVSFPKVVFKAVQRMLALTHQTGDIQGTISKFRYLMRFVETPSTKGLRQALACQFADLLLRGVGASVYEKYNMAPEKVTPMFKQALPIPQRYSAHRYVPDTPLREAILMLLISEHIASQEVILNRPSEISETPFIQPFNNTAAIYDLLAIALARTGNFLFLSKYYRAYLVLRECLRLDASKVSVFLFATSLCLGYLELIEDGIELASQAVQLASSQNDAVICARAHLMLGWGFSLLSRNCQIIEKKRDLHDQAINEYRSACKLDPDDYLSWYHLAVELAVERQLEDALAACQNSLRLMPTHSNTLCLLALIHTAGGKRLDQASKVLRVGLADKPNDFNLLFLLAKIESVRQNTRAGLHVYKRLLEVWRDTFAPDSNSVVLEKMPTSTDVSAATGNTTEDFSPSTPLTSTLVFETEEESIPSSFCTESNYLASALGDIAHGLASQSGTSIAPLRRVHRANAYALSPSARLQAKIYHGLAEWYLVNDQLEEAREALDEAVKITNLDLETLYLRGCLAEKQGMVSKARSIYESVVAIKPTHIRALLALAELLRQNDQANLAERVARDAMSIDPTNCQVWHLLAEILASPSASESASEAAVTKALLTAVELGQTEPIEPFYLMPIGIRCG
ncbi:unnamed protein product [Calicophoron daubneyi]|uniref:Tetratricopeptide repeat protein 7 N-terminal domain-containing protein n=1 Tax=Calicophoron daubneyi TaxID=300641 RepID=A0AAV2TA77_CALDB